MLKFGTNKEQLRDPNGDVREAPESGEPQHEDSAARTSADRQEEKVERRSGSSTPEEA